MSANRSKVTQGGDLLRLDAQEVARLRGEGLAGSEIAKRLKISRASVYRALA
jgi:DNA-binding CsgD family transcriptional regulator